MHKIELHQTKAFGLLSRSMISLSATRYSEFTPINYSITTSNFAFTSKDLYSLDDFFS